MEDSKNPIADKNNHLSKQICISVLQMKSSSTCLITASLGEGPFFYFYVESSPSLSFRVDQQSVIFFNQ
jgi:hypothetical protein